MMTTLSARTQVTWIRPQSGPLVSRLRSRTGAISPLHDQPMIGPGPSCYDEDVRLHSLTCVLLGMGAIAGCGPGVPPSIEGFGSIGETEDPPGDGDGDPGDGDPSG